MRSVSRDLDRVLVPVMMFLLQKRRERRLLNETLRRPTTEIENSRDARVDHHVHHVEHVLNRVEEKSILLLKTRPRNPNRQTTISNRRTEDRHFRLIRRRQHTIFRRDLSQLSAQKM